MREPPTLWPRRSNSLARANRVSSAFVTVLAALAALAGWGAISGPGVPHVWLLGGYGVIGACNVAIGAWLISHRPGYRIGQLVMVVGFTILTASLYNAEHGALVLVGSLAGRTPIAALFHLVVTYPSGRSSDGPTRWLVAALYTVAVTFNAAVYLVDQTHPATLGWLRLDAPPDLAQGLSEFQGWTMTAGIVLGAGVIARRRIAAPATDRRIIAAVHVAGIALVLWFPLSSLVFRRIVTIDPFTLFGLQLLAFVLLPLVVVAPVITGALTRTHDIGELGAWLGAPDDRRPTVRDALARALGDPSIQVVYNVAGTEEYVDEAGLPVVLPDGATRSTWAPVIGPTGRAAIVYDGSLLTDRAEVESAGEVVALAIDHDRLTADLRASQEAVRASRHRIVEYGDHERRRLARNLHDGVQPRLVVAALHAGALAEHPGPLDPAVRAQSVRVRDEVDAAITELRRLAHDVLPELLTERGLFVAVEELVDRMPVRAALATVGDDQRVAPAVASAAYFIVAEAVGNAVKHARAAEVQVTLAVVDDVLTAEVRDDGIGGASRSGSGLRGLFDRAAALDGYMEVHSPAGGGTRLTAELPCGS